MTPSPCEPRTIAPEAALLRAKATAGGPSDAASAPRREGEAAADFLTLLGEEGGEDPAAPDPAAALPTIPDPVAALPNPPRPAGQAPTPPEPAAAAAMTLAAPPVAAPPADAVPVPAETPASPAAAVATAAPASAVPALPAVPAAPTAASSPVEAAAPEPAAMPAPPDADPAPPAEASPALPAQAERPPLPIPPVASPRPAEPAPHPDAPVEAADAEPAARPAPGHQSAPTQATAPSVADVAPAPTDAAAPTWTLAREPAQAAAHRPEPTPPAPSGPAVVAQVAVAVAAADGGSLEIRLDPPELGRVQIHLVPTDGGVQATVLADRPETGDLLRRHAAELARALGEAGYGEVSLDFAAGEAPRDDAPPPRQAAWSVPLAAVEATPGPAPAAPRDAGPLDVRL